MSAAPKITVLFCGQIRHEPVFRLHLGQLIGLRDAGVIAGIALSTWTGEERRLPGLFEDLRRMGVSTALSEEPDRFLIPGSFFHQSKALLAGLRAIDGDGWVLKTRPDVVLSVDRLPDLFRRVTALPDIPGPDRALRRRVWVSSFDLTAPFFMTDLVFLADHADMTRLANLDHLPEIMGFFTENGRDLSRDPGLPGGSEIRRFIWPFLPLHPVFFEYMELWPYFRFGAPEREDVLKTLYRSDIYWEYVALYLKLVQSSFAVGREYYTGNIDLVRDVKVVDGRLQCFGAAYGPGADVTVPAGESRWRHLNGQGHAFCNEASWIPSLFEGPCDDPMASRLRGAIGPALAWRNDAGRRAAFRDLKEAVRRAAGFSSPAPLGHRPAAVSPFVQPPPHHTAHTR